MRIQSLPVSAISAVIRAQSASTQRAMVSRTFRAAQVSIDSMAGIFVFLRRAETFTDGTSA